MYDKTSKEKGCEIDKNANRNLFNPLCLNERWDDNLVIHINPLYQISLTTWKISKEKYLLLFKQEGSVSVFQCEYKIDFLLWKQINDSFNCNINRKSNFL